MAICYVQDIIDHIWIIVQRRYSTSAAHRLLDAQVHNTYPISIMLGTLLPNIPAEDWFASMLVNEYLVLTKTV